MVFGETFGRHGAQLKLLLISGQKNVYPDVRISSYAYNTTWTDDFKHKKKDNVASQLGKKLFRQLQESKHICGTGTVLNLQLHRLMGLHFR